MKKANPLRATRHPLAWWLFVAWLLPSLLLAAPAADADLAAMRQAFEQQQPQQVERLAKAILQQDPAQKEAMFYLAKLAQVQGHKQQAIIWLDGILTLDADNLAVRMNRAQLLQDTDQLNRARADYRYVQEHAQSKAEFERAAEAALQRLVLDETVRIKAVGQAFDARKAAEVVQLAHQLLLDFPEQKEAMYYLSRVDLMRGNVDQGIAWLDRILMLDPDNLSIRLNRAKALQQAHFLERAGDDYHFIQDHAANDPAYLTASDAGIKAIDAARSKAKSLLEQGKHLAAKKPDQALRLFTQAQALEQPGPELLYEVAQLYLRKNDPRTGIRLLERALQQAPDNQGLRMFLARAYEANHNWKQARLVYQQAVSTGSPEVAKEANKRLQHVAEEARKQELRELRVRHLIDDARQAMGNNDLRQAEQKLKQILELQAGHAEALYLLARLYLAEDKLRLGAEYMERSYKADPKNLAVLLSLGRAYDLAGLFSSARKTYQEVLKRAAPDAREAVAARQGLATLADGMEQRLRALLDKEPSAAHALRLAQFLLGGSKLAAGKQVLTDMIQRFPDAGETQVARHNLARLLSNEGLKLLQSSKIEEGKTHLLQAYELDPDYGQVNALLAIFYTQEKSYAKAVPHILKVLKEKPNDLQLYLDLASAYDQSGQLDEAAATYAQLTAREEKVTRAEKYGNLITLTLGKKYMAEKDYDRAASALENLQVRTPDNIQVLQMLAVTYQVQKDYDGVILMREAIFSLQPDDDRSELELARAYARVFRYDEAMRLYAKLAQKTKNKRLRDFSQNLVAQLERSRRIRINASLGYSLTASRSVATINRDIITRSNTSLSLQGQYLTNGGNQFSLAITPQYSLSHRTQTDAFNTSISLSALLRPTPDQSWSVVYSFSESESLLLNQKNSFNRSLSISPSLPASWVPRALPLLLWPFKQVPSTLTVRAQWTDSNAFTSASQLFVTQSLGGSVLLAQPLGRRGRSSLSYRYADTQNKNRLATDLANTQQSLSWRMSQNVGDVFDDVGRGLFDLWRKVWRVKQDGVGEDDKKNRRLPTGGLHKLTLSFSHAFTFSQYSNLDSAFKARRKTLARRFSLGFSYRFSRMASLSFNYGWNKQKANLGTGVMLTPQGTPFARHPAALGSFFGRNVSSTLSFIITF